LTLFILPILFILFESKNSVRNEWRYFISLFGGNKS
jgi:hypothetical protein